METAANPSCEFRGGGGDSVRCVSVLLRCCFWRAIVRLVTLSDDVTEKRWPRITSSHTVYICDHQEARNGFLLAISNGEKRTRRVFR